MCIHLDVSILSPIIFHNADTFRIISISKFYCNSDLHILFEGFFVMSSKYRTLTTIISSILIFAWIVEIITHDTFKPNKSRIFIF